MRILLLCIILFIGCNKTTPVIIFEQLRPLVIKATVAVLDDLIEGNAYAQARIVINTKPAAFTLFTARNEANTLGSLGGAALLAYPISKTDELLTRIGQSGRDFKSPQTLSAFLSEHKFGGLEYRREGDAVILNALDNDTLKIEAHYSVNALFSLYQAKRKRPGSSIYIREAIDSNTNKPLPIFSSSMPVIAGHAVPPDTKLPDPKKNAPKHTAQLPPKDGYEFNPDYLHRENLYGLRPTLARPVIRDGYLVLKAMLHTIPPDADSIVLWTVNCNIKNENIRYAPGNYCRKVFSLQGNRKGYEIRIPLAELPLSKNRQSGTLISAMLGIFDRDKKLLMTSNGAFLVKITVADTGLAVLQ